MMSAAGSQSKGKANVTSPEKAKKDKAKEPQEKKSKDKKADSSGEAAARGHTLRTPIILGGTGRPSGWSEW